MTKLRIIWVVSLVATLGSLYFSEIMGFMPCTLCWYQRILMYPLPIIFGIAMFRNDKHIVLYTLPLTILGFIIGSYHYLMQKTELFKHAATCKVGVPCSGEYINWFGFITIPFLSLTAFFIITTVSILVIRQNKKDKLTN